jgi:predicted Zn-dependent protease
MRTASIILACALLVQGCEPMPPPPRGDGRRPIGEGPGGRPQPLGLSGQKELEVGRHARDEMLREYRGKLFPEGSAPARRAQAVVTRLAKAAAIEILQREINLRVRGYRFEWEVFVVQDGTVNAFCLPAGKMFVLSGLLKVTGDSDDFLATVLSHEMAHALAHHASERVARAKSPQGILDSLSYGRMQEEEADHIGIFLMAFAGYDPGRAPVFWRQMHAARKGGEVWEIFSSHPNDESRIRALSAQAPRAAAAKRAYDRMQAARR